jgi:mono/diheme cytochrome c family protein
MRTVFHGSLARQFRRCEAAEVQMRAKHVMLAAAIALAIPTGPGEAQEIGQPSRGLVLAQRLCAECHAVQKEYSRSPNANAPRFQAIASIPGMTAIALSAAFNTSHRAMPNIMLAADEQADMIAYILSLK